MRYFKLFSTTSFNSVSIQLSSHSKSLCGSQVLAHRLSSTLPLAKRLAMPAVKNSFAALAGGDSDEEIVEEQVPVKEERPQVLET